MPGKIEANRGDVLLMVGTRKGAFFLTADAARKSWSLSGPHHVGSDVFHLAYDYREAGTIFAAINSPIWGPEVQRSEDLGATWRKSRVNPAFPKERNDSVEQVWHIEPGRPSEPGVVYAGVSPAALFKSSDGGETWERGRPSLRAPDPCHVGGGIWRPVPAQHGARPCRRRPDVGGDIGGGGIRHRGRRGKLVYDERGRAGRFHARPLPELGQCPHKMLAHPSRPGRLYQQNHCGFYRSDDGGRRWLDLSDGLPSRFGLVMGTHSNDADTVYVVPEDKALGTDVGGGVRYVTDARFRVYRSHNAGADWEPLTRGLPQRNAYLHVLREGMATDSLDECGVYVGTTTGQIFYSRDDGDTWELMIDHLPPINSVDAGLIV